MTNIISEVELSSLEKAGYLLIKNFFSECDLNPLMKELANLAQAFGLTNEQIMATKNIDEAFVNIINTNHKLKSFLYDRLQLLSQLLRVPSHDKIQSLSKLVLNTENIGVWPRMQLRLDLANDSENLIEWHTDYVYNRGTEQSYTFWLPIVPISKEMGPIKMVPGSHKKEYKFITSTKERRHSFSLGIEEIKKLNIIQLEQFQAGDLVIFHSKFLHSGVVNSVKDRARLVCVFRMQNINELEIFTGD